MVVAAVAVASTGAGVGGLTGAPTANGEGSGPPFIAASGPVAAPVAATIYLAGSARFEVVAPPGDEGRRLAGLAETVWPVWKNSIGLPDRLPVSMIVRLADPERWSFPEPGWRVVAEPGGVVTVWIRGGGAPGVPRERRWLMALAEAALVRQAILTGALEERRRIPPWMIAGAAEEALARQVPAMQDAWQQATERGGAGATMRELFAWKGIQTDDEAAHEARRRAAYGLWQWLQAEAGRGGAWRRLSTAVWAGTAPGLALVRAYPERFAGMKAEELELAWAVGAAGLAKVRSGPVMEPAESRRWLEWINRVVAIEAAVGREQTLGLGTNWQGRADAFLRAERAARIGRLNALQGRMHPFYRNAAGSLGRLFLALDAADAPRWVAAREEWLADFALGLELERASAAVLAEEARRTRD